MTVDICFTVQAGHAGYKLGPFLRAQGASASLVRSVKFTEGGLRVNGEAARTSRVLAAGDEVVMRLPSETGHSAQPEDIPLQVLEETRHVMVLDKPAGLVAHPTRTHTHGTLANAFCGLMQQRGRVGVYRCQGRLDANTSGLVLCAMNMYAASALAGRVKKTYLALVQGRLPPGGGSINRPIAPREDSVIQQQVAPGGRPSLTEYEVLAAGQKATLVAVWPQTGRTHQIRVHFASMGHPLLGDGLYGGPLDVMQRHALHCAALYFQEPQGEWRWVFSPLPQDMRDAATALGCGLAGLPEFVRGCQISGRIV